jgi:hypothetical protein
MKTLDFEVDCRAGVMTNPVRTHRRWVVATMLAPEKKLFGIWISCPAYLSGSVLQEQQTRNSITIKIL